VAPFCGPMRPARCDTWRCWKAAGSIGRSGTVCPRWSGTVARTHSCAKYGEMAFAHARANPDGYGAVFGRAMSGFSATQSAWALEALRDYDFSSVATWCDVGGGHSHLMCSFPAAYPHLSGTVLDLPEVLAEKDQLWAGRLEASGWRFVACHYPSHGKMGVVEGVVF
jgi:hypothetical protein